MLTTLRALGLIGCLAILAVIAGCSAKVEEHTLSSGQVAAFDASAETIRLSEDPDSPLAGLMWKTNRTGAPLGMQIWNPDPVLAGIGIRNGDVIALIDDDDLYPVYEQAWRSTGQPFRRGQFNQGPNHAEAAKYVSFAGALLERVRTNGRVLLTVHERFYKQDDVDAYGQYAAEPRQIVIEWSDTPSSS